MISISLWRKADVETIRGPCGLKKSKKKNKLLEALSLQAQPKKKQKQLKLWLLDKVFVP